MSKGRKETENYEKGNKRTRSPNGTRWIAPGLALCVVIVIGTILLSPHTKAGPPKISFSETFWNFGRAPQQSRISHTFWIKNTGGDTLRIMKVKPG